MLNCDTILVALLEMCYELMYALLLLPVCCLKLWELLLRTVGIVASCMLPGILKCGLIYAAARKKLSLYFTRCMLIGIESVASLMMLSGIKTVASVGFQN